MNTKIEKILGSEASFYLDHVCRKIGKRLIHAPSSDTVDRLWVGTDRNVRTLCSLQTLLGHGRLAGTGYLSIRASNIRQAPRSHPILFISIRRISFAWRSREAATP